MTADLCALAKRFLGGRVEKWARGDRWSWKTKGNEPNWSTRWTGTTAELRAKVDAAAVKAVADAKAKWRAAYDRRLELPKLHEQQRESLELRQAADRAKAEVDYDDAEKACDEAEARLAEVRAALGEVAQ